MSKRWLLIITLLVFSNLTYGLNLKKLDTVVKPFYHLKPKVLLDSFVVNDKLDWSVRLVSNFKEQRFKLSNDEGSINYIPNNPFGIGVGIANQKLVIDILFNIKTKNKEHTNKLAAEGSLMLNKNFFTFLLENVQGYNVSNSFNDLEEFREDFKLFSAGLSYLYLFNNKYITPRAMKSGLYNYDKPTISLGLGGFFIINSLHTEGSIVPEELLPFFNEQAQITELFAFGAGVLGGFITYIPLPANFFLSLHLAPGIGLNYKNIQTETVEYKPERPILYKADAFGAIGYNRKKFYINFTYATSMFFTSIDYDNRTSLRVTKSKLIFGYNIGKIGKKKKK